MNRTFYHERGTVYFKSIVLSENDLLTIALVWYLFEHEAKEQFRQAIKERDDYLARMEYEQLGPEGNNI